MVVLGGKGVQLAAIHGQKMCWVCGHGLTALLACCCSRSFATAGAHSCGSLMLVWLHSPPEHQGRLRFRAHKQQSHQVAQGHQPKLPLCVMLPDSDGCTSPEHHGLLHLWIHIALLAAALCRAAGRAGAWLGQSEDARCEAAPCGRQRRRCSSWTGRRQEAVCSAPEGASPPPRLSGRPLHPGWLCCAGDGTCAAAGVAQLCEPATAGDCWGLPAHGTRERVCKSRLP